MRRKRKAQWYCAVMDHAVSPAGRTGTLQAPFRPAVDNVCRPSWRPSNEVLLRGQVPLSTGPVGQEERRCITSTVIAPPFWVRCEVTGTSGLGLLAASYDLASIRKIFASEGTPFESIMKAM